MSLKAEQDTSFMVKKTCEYEIFKKTKQDRTKEKLKNFQPEFHY